MLPERDLELPNNNLSCVKKANKKFPNRAKRYFDQVVDEVAEIKETETKKPLKNENKGPFKIKRFSRSKFPNRKRKFLDNEDESPVPIDEERLKRYDAEASQFDPKSAKTRIQQERLAKKKKRFLERVDKTARAEILTKHEPGGIELGEEDNYIYKRISQTKICEAVDIASATKYFDLNLETFGPYRFNYTRNGRFIVMGGHKGHLATFDWMTKDLKHETNVMESIRDVQWLHVEKMYAVAQKRWLRIYDDAGTELHCMKGIFDIQRLEFLPRHMLLVASSNNSFLHYLDTCIGKIVNSFPTCKGPLNVMTQNPGNAIILTGSTRGVVSMWSPNSKQSLVELLTHKSAVTGLAVDESGTYMATTGLDKKLRVWDLRMYKEMHSYTSPINLSHLAFSHRRYLAAAAAAKVQVFNDAHLGHTTTPYLQQKCNSLVSDLQFCPYEDVLGIGTQTGFVSILVPGAGDPNIGTDNPFETKTQRREREVRMLLDKIQPELISLDPLAINRLNRINVNKTLEYKKKVLRIKPDQPKMAIVSPTTGQENDE